MSGNHQGRGLDTQWPDPLYVLGRVVALVEHGRGELVDLATHDLCCAHPLAGLAKVLKEAAGLPDDYDHGVGRALALLTPDQMPAGPVAIEDQSAYWMGLMQQRAALQAWRATLNVEDLTAIGKALYGDRWQTALTDALGLGDSARMREWVSGRRPMPKTLAAELLSLCRYRSRQTWELANAIEQRQRPKAD